MARRPTRTAETSSARRSRCREIPWVGAPREDSAARGVNGNQADNSAEAAGAVYVFVRSGTTWSQQAYLKASNINAHDDFGISVALSGDTLAVGASGESSAARGINGNQNDNSASAAGAVYVFQRTSSTWAQQANDTLAVGTSESDGASFSGAVYVFFRSAGRWTQQAFLKASNFEASDDFGGSVAISGDTLIVGATGEDSIATGVNGNQNDNTALGAGAAYRFTRSGTAWTQQAYLKASNTERAFRTQDGASTTASAKRSRCLEPCWWSARTSSSAVPRGSMGIRPTIASRRLARSTSSSSRASTGLHAPAAVSARLP